MFTIIFTTLRHVNPQVKRRSNIERIHEDDVKQLPSARYSVSGAYHPHLSRPIISPGDVRKLIKNSWIDLLALKNFIEAY